MEEEYKNYPFYDWVPKPLGIIFMIILFVPMITMSGVYSANSGEMMSGLGIQSEYIAFAGFCTSIGMAAFSPFFYELVCIRREKMMCIVGFSILFILSFVCAQTDSLFILGLCSLLMGFVRQTLLMAHLFVLIRYGFGIEESHAGMRAYYRGSMGCGRFGEDGVAAGHLSLLHDYRTVGNLANGMACLCL